MRLPAGRQGGNGCGFECVFECGKYIKMKENTFMKVTAFIGSAWKKHTYNA